MSSRRSSSFTFSKGPTELSASTSAPRELEKPCLGRWLKKLISFASSARITYSKKKDKQASITFKKDNMVPRDDVYKSSTVSVPQGEAPNSQSMPPAERKPRVKKAAPVRQTANVSSSISLGI